MNKRQTFVISLLVWLLPTFGQATETLRLETSVAGFIQLPGSGRQVYNFNPGWRYLKGDAPGAEAVGYDGRSWQVVSTPHTVELMPAEASGCRNYQGPAWYRKHFVVPAQAKGQHVSIHFEAAMGKQMIYLNGKIYFHCAKVGHKLDALASDDRVSFCVMDEGFRKNEEWALNIKSIVIFGCVKKIDSSQEKEEIVRQIGLKYYPTVEGVEEEIKKAGAHVQILELSIYHMTGKLVNES